MTSEKIRKDIHLSADVIDVFQKCADKESRTLKNYIEKVLIKHSDKVKNGSKVQDLLAVRPKKR